jgi:hypothetical protein
MFLLNSLKEIDYVPMIGDEIETCNEDFMKSTFRIKPWFKDKQRKFSNSTYLNFKVISRKYSIRFDTWELTCEPTADSLLYLLSNIKTV